MMSFKPTCLKCNYSEKPIGNMDRIPLFSFRLETNKMQKAYRLIVSGTKENMDAGIGDAMDSGKVFSDCNMQIPYLGQELLSKQRYYWKVKVWTKDDMESEFSDTEWFENGIFDEKEWNAKWIGSPVFGSLAPCFRNSFHLDSKVVRARAYITGLGYYKLFVNGNGINEHRLNPAFTDINKTLLYKVFDITEYLTAGTNVIGVMLGCGFYNSEHFNTSHRTLMFMMQLEIQLLDGTKINLITDRNCGWEVTDKSSILENGLYDGEYYNALNEITNWNTTERNEEMKQYFKEPLIMPAPKGVLKTESLEDIQPVQDIPYQSVQHIKDNIFVYDIGQNISGYVKIKVRGRIGTKIKISYSELVEPNGLVNKENLRRAKACDLFVVSKNTEEIYEPYFTNHGFRYVQIEIIEGEAAILEAVGRWVRSACEQIGSFSCDNEMINRLHKAIVFTEGNNLQGLPVDCPQRDERLGWLNDAVVRTEEAMYNFDVTKLLSKWMYDIKDTQDPIVGAIADTAPHIRYGRYPADPVCSSYLIVPWMIYLHCGDTSILKEHYDGMKKWNQYIGEQANAYIVEYSSYGDWAGPINTSIEGSAGAGAVSAITPGNLMSTGYYYYNSVLLTKIAGILNHTADQEHYTILSGKIKEAFNHKFFDKGKKCYAANSQASNIFPLYLGLVEKENVTDVLNHVIADITMHDTHFTTGNLCTKYLIEVLTKAGYIDTAYSLVTTETYPGWGYMLKHGATTIWERFELVERGELCEMASHNHPMYGSVGAWFYMMLAGIMPSEEKPGFSEVIIKPYMPTELRHVKASVKTQKGYIKSEWIKNEKGYSLHVELPYNSTGKICFFNPEDSFHSVQIKSNDKIIWNQGKGTEDVKMIEHRIVCSVPAGTYSFQYEWEGVKNSGKTD